MAPKPIRRVGSSQGQPRNSKIRENDLSAIASALGMEIKDLVTTARRVQKRADEQQAYQNVLYRHRAAQGR